MQRLINTHEKYNYLTITLFFLINILSAQSVDISILSFKDQYKGDEPIWYNCDSAFYKSDTVTFTTFGYSGCSCFSFKIRQTQITEIQGFNACVEPPTATLWPDIRNGKIKKRSGIYYLYIYKSDKVWKAFKIMELNQKSYFDQQNYPRQYYLMRLLKV